DGIASVAVRPARRSTDVRWSEHRLVGGDPHCRSPAGARRTDRTQGRPGRRTIAFIMPTVPPRLASPPPLARSRTGRAINDRLRAVAAQMGAHVPPISGARLDAGERERQA